MAEKQSNGILSLIGGGTLVEGKISTDGSVRVDGRLLGDILSKENVTVGATGTVEGTIQGVNVSLAGSVVGTVIAAGKLVLESRSVMKGDLRAQRLVVDEGAVFDGTCVMSKGETKSDPAKPPLAAPPKH